MKSKKKMKNNRSSPSDHKSLESEHQSSSKTPSLSVRRSSKRIQNTQKSVTTSSEVGLVDSAYDADEESITPNSSPGQETEQQRDPYSIDMIEDDVPEKTSQRRKNDTKKTNRQRLTTKKLRKADNSPSANIKNMPTSTPVLHSSGGVASKLQGEAGHSLPVTPEVTPILPYKPHECGSPKNDSFTTPQIHRPSRKRSLLPESFTSLSVQLSYSSQGDSGIVLSPVSKKQRPAHKHIPEPDSKSQKSLMPSKKKDEHFPLDFNCNPINKKKNNFSLISETNVPELRKTEKINEKKRTRDDSCFGFDTLASPLIACENSPPFNRKQLKSSRNAKKENVTSKDGYRLVHASSSDSSLTCITNEPIVSLGSGSSEENTPRTKSASPTLFSDSFSADYESLEMEVNKSSRKSYAIKPYKVRKMKENASVSKLDMWASNFNMEIEDIEKFDLNIE